MYVHSLPVFLSMVSISSEDKLDSTLTFCASISMSTLVTSGVEVGEEERDHGCIGTVLVACCHVLTGYSAQDSVHSSRAALTGHNYRKLVNLHS